MIKEIPFIKIEKDNRIYYGGSQEWFDDKFSKLAGCASVLATNLYYIYTNHIDVQYEEFRQQMDIMFKLNKPGFIGFPYFYKFAHNFENYLNNQDIHLKAIYQKNSSSVDKGFRFIKKHINAGRPIGMLILTHKAKEIEEETWHWMCITGYDDEQNEIIISSVGEKITMKADVLFAQDYRNVVKMMTFMPK